ncbi:hypothetical protein HC026_11155 [Lactobacillus sp. LC28-10]|uniref:Uncharacterized protein n=1 Tax=Secundilactobacillus angelensis TaxID=2722706 RepID=A0ABX1L1X4_9LACO|nr:hypothetical protein [Secundilactobacillus angelensis]MCH5463191.1 hypothetical protein [Secundilactobacillus angelensis]NLR19450.1 hypothetical protein [Secundilactobacillus angelensis]
MFTYIKYDSDGFVTQYQNTEADGFTKTYLLDSWIPKFAQWPNKFRYDTEKNALLNPGNLPDISLADLNKKYQDLLNTSKQVTESTTTIAQQQTQDAESLTQVQQAITTMAMANAMATNNTNKEEA